MYEAGLTPPCSKEHNWSFSFPECEKLPPPVMPFPGVSFSYSGKKEDHLYENVELAIDCDSRVALVGPNGAGKSTLANTLIGEEAMEVQAVRDMDGKGRHTTTTRNLLTLPGGGALIDTPGLRGVGLWDAGSGVERVFAEIEEYARQCRFQDCAHDSEPGCAVLAALDTGELPVRRLESYRKLQRENQRIVAKTDARLRQERLGR